MRKNNPNTPCQTDPWASSTYQTGSTTPPKSRNGIIAALLVLVIVLCGIITVLGITNAQLFRLLSGQDDNSAVPIAFSNARQITTYGAEPVPMQISEDSVSLCAPLGIQGDSVPKVCQLYYRLPNGLYVQQIDPLSSCAHRGLQPGDIITQVDGFSITSAQDFHAALGNYAIGDTVTLTVYRNSRHFPVSVIVEPSR